MPDATHVSGAALTRRARTPPQIPLIVPRATLYELSGDEMRRRHRNRVSFAGG